MTAAAKPLMSGRVDFTNGAFTVAPAGVGYRGLNGRVDLQPGRAVINQLSVTDEHDRTMALSGQLGLQGRALGALQLKVTSHKFEVLHNDVGRVTLNSDLTITTGAAASSRWWGSAGAFWSTCGGRIWPGIASWSTSWVSGTSSRHC